MHRVIPSKHVKAKSERDKHVVEAVVRQFGPISRARIHEMTQIRPTATSNIVRRLLDEGRLLEDGVESGPLGRKGALLRLNEQHGYVACIDFDDESITAGITDLHPRVTRRISIRTDLNNGAVGLIRQLIDTTRKALKSAGVSVKSLAGIGIADPGLVDSRRGVTVTSSTIPFWKDIPLQAVFEKEFGVPALVETSTRSKTVAERDADPTSRPDSMIYVDYGAGIGAGLFVDGRLLYGQGSAAGEFGHTRIVDDGTACNCGSFGCLEAIAGLRAVEARVRRAIADGGNTEVLAMAGEDPSRITGWMVFEAASRGDKIASNTVADIGRYLGLGIANLVNLFNPAEIVLDGRLRLAGDELLNQINSTIRRQALRESTENLVLRYGVCGNDAGVLGVARMVLTKHFEIPALKLPRFLVEGADMVLTGKGA